MTACSREVTFCGKPKNPPLTSCRTFADIAPEVPHELLLAGMSGWIQMFGAISLELFGQFNNVIDARDEFFHEQMELMADLMGL